MRTERRSSIHFCSAVTSSQSMVRQGPPARWVWGLRWGWGRPQRIPFSPTSSLTSLSSLGLPSGVWRPPASLWTRSSSRPLVTSSSKSSELSQANTRSLFICNKVKCLQNLAQLQIEMCGWALLCLHEMGDSQTVNEGWEYFMFQTHMYLLTCTHMYSHVLTCTHIY